MNRLLARFGYRARSFLLLIIASAALFYIGTTIRNVQPGTVAAAAILFVALIGLFVTAQGQVSKAPPPAVTTTLLTPTLVVSEVRAAALITYAQVGTVTIKKERDAAPPNSILKPLHDKLLGEEIVADVGVRVVAGVNLKHLREEDVQVESQRASVTLPPAKVLMVYVDESLTRVVSHRAGWFTGRDLSLMASARREAMEALVNAALENGLLEKAGQQAATVIASIVRGLGFEEVSIYPTLPPAGAHFEELNDPALIRHIQAEPAPLLPRDDQAGDA
jgi:hypothetical protein